MTVETNVCKEDEYANNDVTSVQSATMENVKRRKRSEKPVYFFAGETCKYKVVRKSASKLGWKIIGDEDSDRLKRMCNVIWIDTSNVYEYMSSIQPWQRINHFPGMGNIARKTRLAENLSTMKKRFHEEYSFFPMTYILPRDKLLLKRHFEPSGSSKATFIIKPDGGAQGKGIFLTKQYADVENLASNSSTFVAQRYIGNPLLIDGKKFDLRIYVLITSCSPLRIYLFRDGLVRLCTQDFNKPNSKNMTDRCMHLTNYSINKRSDSFEGAQDKEGSSGSKRSIAWLLSWLSEERGPEVAKKLWNQIGEICVKTILSIAPTLEREYKMTFGLHSAPHEQDTVSESSTIKEVKGSRCFAVLGIDILIDSNLKPYLIEVNHLPSFGTDSSVDEEIKSKVVLQALSAVEVDSSDQKTYEKGQKARARQRLLHKTSRHEMSYSCQGPVQDYSNMKEVERYIEKVYSTYAPDKAEKVKDLMKKYKGYEEWLVHKIHDKYCLEETETNDSDSDSDDSAKGLLDLCSGVQDEAKWDREERVLQDYDRLYPPKTSNADRQKYEEMMRYATEEDLNHQSRLTCPLWQTRKSFIDETSDLQNMIPEMSEIQRKHSRGDWLVNGNIHLKKREVLPIKVLKPPTDKQVEAADRLSRGFSVDYSTHHDSLRPTFMTKLSRISEAHERSMKQRHDEHYNKRSQLVMKPVQIEFNEDLWQQQHGIGDRYYVDFVGRKLAYNL